MTGSWAILLGSSSSNGIALISTLWISSIRPILSSVGDARAKEEG